MKKIIIKKIIKYIKNNCNYNKQQLLEIEYGLLSIYLSISKIIIISLIAYFLGLFKEMIIFMIFFNIVRSTAYGLHATKSWICLLSSIIIFIGLPFLCKSIEIDNIFKLIIGMISIILIYKNAPADTKKRPIVNKKRRLILKIVSTFISIAFIESSLIINDNFISNCLVLSIILENFLISPFIYKIFNLPYNNYIEFLKSHPDFNQ